MTTKLDKIAEETTLHSHERYDQYFVKGFKKAIEEAKSYASGSSGHTYDHFMQIIKHLESFTKEEHARD